MKGTIRSAKGYLGEFEIVVDDFANAAPSSRAALAFAPGRDGAVSHCDLILDISGGAPLFPAHDLRDGYLRADPARPGRSPYVRLSRRAISSALSTSRVTSRSVRNFARIPVRISSAAVAVSISVRPVRSNLPAITSPSTPTFVPGAASAPPYARPVRLPMRCRRPMR